MNEILFELLRKYVSGTMTGEEKKAFEQRCSDDPAFAAEVAEYAAMLAAIREEGDLRLAEQLKAYAETLSGKTDEPVLQTSKVRPMTIYRRILYAAAAIVALFIVALPLWMNNRTAHTPDQIFAAHFRTPPTPQVRDAGTEAWRMAYGRGDYRAATQELKTQLADATLNQRSEALLYLGISQLAQGNTSEALEALKQVGKDSYDWEPAQWFTALALLKSGKKGDAEIIIDDIVHQSGHPYREAAQAVQAEMKE